MTNHVRPLLEQPTCHVMYLVFACKRPKVLANAVILLLLLLLLWYIQRKLANLCSNRFIRSIFFVIMNVLNYLRFKTLYSRHQNLFALFLINVFKNKINSYSVVHAVGLRVLTKQIRDFSAFNFSNFSRLGPSARCVIAANICRSLDVFSKHNISLEDTFLFG
jgi:hypothetical protein